jgi:gliding motility-associated lipoprotein GldH
MFTAFAACTEKGKIMDQMVEIPNSKWSYEQIPQFPFSIDNASMTYSFYLKLRIQKTYPFENLYLLSHIRQPSGKISTVRLNFTLTDDMGRPLGKSSGNSIDYEIPMIVNRKMEGVGQYSVALEQNLRDSVVIGIESIGVKIKEGIPVF